MRQRALGLLKIAGLVALVVLAYGPAWRAGFLWDDNAHLTRPDLRPAGGLARIWSEIGATQQYYPVLHSAFWLEHRLWGLDPRGYHAANLALHALAAVLLGALLRRLAVPGPWLAAAWFALHPVHVESVAWISEQKNTLSTVFYLGAALAYLRFETERRPGAYWLALGLFVLALLSKTVTATLPAALLVLGWWRRGSVSWHRDVVPLLPWFALALAAGVTTAWIERRLIGAEGAAFELTFLQRLLLAGRVVWFYAGKLLWPQQLTFIYPRWTIEPARLADWAPLLATAGLLALLWRLRVRSRGPLAAALLFGGTLFPVLGFFNVYPFQYSFVADHFQYLASMALIAFAVSALTQTATVGASLPATRTSIGSRTAGAALRAVRGRLGEASLPGLLMLAALAMQTRAQAHLYRDNEALFRATVARNPDAWMAHNNLAQILMTRSADRPAAMRHLQRALALRPDYPEALNNLGLVLAQSGRPAEGLALIERALRLKPHLSEAHNNRGIALTAVGRGEEAVAAFRRAGALNPAFPNIHENLGKLLDHLGRHAEAAESFAEAKRLRGAAAAR